MENWLEPELPKTEREKFYQYLESKKEGKGYEKDMSIKAHAELVEFGEKWELECFNRITNEQGEIDVEVKFDGQAQKTGNLFIETHEWVKDDEGGHWKETGITASRASLWWYWFPIDDLMYNIVETRENLYDIENYLKKIGRWKETTSGHITTTKKLNKGWLLPLDIVAPHCQEKLKTTILSKPKNTPFTNTLIN